MDNFHAVDFHHCSFSEGYGTAIFASFFSACKQNEDLITKIEW